MFATPTDAAPPAKSPTRSDEQVVPGGNLKWDISVLSGKRFKVVFTYTPTAGNTAKNITFIQVVMQSTVNNVATYPGEKKDRAFYKSLQVPDSTTRLDLLPTEDDPYFGAEWDGKKWVDEGETTSQLGNGPSMRPAMMTDRPGLDPSSGKSVKTFETAVFSIDSQEVIAVVTWGAIMTDNGPIELLPVQLFSSASTNFKKAVAKANTIDAIKHKVTAPTGNLFGGKGSSALP
jgi:hypothetical protein